MSIVSTNVPYNSTLLNIEIYELLKTYPFLNLQVVGTSVLGKPIYVIRLGKGKKHVFYSASIHANEWITTPVLMKFIEDFCISYTSNQNIYGYSARNIFNNTSIYIMPMCNPDVVDLVTGNLSSISFGYRKARKISNNFPSIPFPNGWKANINGVDFFNFQHTLLINRLDWRLLCLIILFSKFLHLRFFHYLLIYYHLLYLND